MSATVHTNCTAHRKLNSSAGRLAGADERGVTMLYEFLKSNRADLIARCRAKAAKRALPDAMPALTEYGIPLFLEQLIETFRLERTPEAMARHKAAGRRRPSLALVPSDIASAAAKHGDELRRQGLTINQVVHGYGDLCQSLTELAIELDAPITVDEFHTFNRCLDDAIADAVTGYSRDMDNPISSAVVPATKERPGPAAQEMRNLIETALLSFAAIKGGHVGMKGTTAAVHERSLIGLRDLFDRALADARAHADVPGRDGGSGSVETPAAKAGRSP